MKDKSIQEEIREGVAKRSCESVGDCWEDLAETEGGLFPSKQDYLEEADQILKYLDDGGFLSARAYKPFPTSYMEL